MSLGSVVVRLTMDTATFDTDAGRAAKIAEKRAKEIDASFKKAGVAIGVALSAAAVGITAALKNSINAMDDMSKSAQKVGITTEKFSKLTYAAGLADVSMETLVGSLGKLTKSQAAALKGTGDQAKVFEALGISIKNADGSLRDSSDVLGDFADRFRDLKGSPEAMAAGFSLFGRSFQELIPLLKDGGDGIRDAGAELEALGGVLSTEAGQNAEAFNDNLTRLETAARSLSMQVASNLLPDLVALSDRFVGTAKDGREVEETATAIADGLRAIGDVIGFLTPLWTAFVDVVRGLAINLAAMGDVIGGLATLDKDQWGRGVSGIIDGYSLAIMGRDKVGKDGTGKKADEGNGRASRGGRRGVKVNIRAESSQAEVDAYTRQLQSALGGNTGGGTGKSKGGGSGGKSDAAKQADKLNDSYQRMVAQLKEQAAMVGVVSGVERLRYELNNGEMAKLSEGQKSELLNLAQIAEFRAKDYEELQKNINIEKERNRVIDDNREAVDGMIEDMEFELKLLGLSNIEREKEIALRYAGADATEAQRQKIADLIDAQDAADSAMSDQIELMDSVRDAGKNFFTDFVGGSKSFKDSMLDAFDSVHQKILEMIAENLMDQLFGKKGEGLGGIVGGLFGGGKAASSDGGMDWGAIIGSFFGGGKASGGTARANTMYEVNERGFEMATVGGRDYMLTGNSPVQITPNHKLGGGGNTQNNQFVFAAPTSPKTQTQIAARVGYEMRRAQRLGS